MKKEEAINLDNIWIGVVKTIDNIKNKDSKKAKQLIESINEINMALKSGESDRLLYTNALICSRFPEIIFAPNSGINRVSKEFMETMSISIQRDSLKAIGIQQYNAFVADKLIQVMGEVGKISIKRVLRNSCGLHVM
jgi:hypothetical protein